LTSKLKILGANIICHSSCFGGDKTPKIIPVRALENQVFFISCNRVGSEPFGNEVETYRGNSQIVDPDGNILSKADSNEKLDFVSINIETSNQPSFGSLITKDFFSEHNRYRIEFRN
jgi:predicted amidohydrolase